MGRFRSWSFVGCGALFTLFGAYASGLRVNLSESMPKGLYWFSRCGRGVADEIAVGDVVAIALEAASERNESFRFFKTREYFSATGTGRDLLLKVIAGKAGDRVEVRGNRLKVNETVLSDRASTRFPQAIPGQPIPTAPTPLTIPPGHIWLSSEHERGIDSRYFGPVSAEAIECVAEPLWVF